MALASKASSARATVVEVARLAGVSTATVSRVLNDPEIVAPPTRQRVLDAVEALAYRPNAAARRLAGARTDTLGLILPELSGPFYSELLAGVEEASRLAGYHLLVAATEPDDFAAHSLPPVDPVFVDGTIVLPHSLDGGLVDRLVEGRRPTVLVERSHPRLPTVAFDPSGGVTAAIRHLVRDHGARRIACVAGPQDAEASRIREAAYAEALRAEGLEADARLLVRGDWSEVGGLRLVEELLAIGAPFDAAFAVNDETALGVIRGLELAGRRVPDNARVVGFDDIPLAGWIRPALTTVAAPPRVLGRTAAEILIRRIAGRPTPLATRISTSLVIRSTCGCMQEEHAR